MPEGSTSLPTQRHDPFLRSQLKLGEYLIEYLIYIFPARRELELYAALPPEVDTPQEQGRYLGNRWPGIILMSS